MNDIKNRICAIIPTRYPASRLPGKPLLKINNKTIIQRTFEQTNKSKYINDVVVACDDNIEIMNNIKNINGKCIMVFDDCLNGTERICKVLNKIDEKYDIIVNVQGDEPFINPDNIDYAIKKYLENESDENMVCTTIHYKINNIDEITSNKTGKMILDKYNNVLYCSRSVIPASKNNVINLETTNYYGHIGIFVFRRKYLESYLNSYNTPAQISEDIEWLKILEHGYKIKSYMVDSYEIGINTIEDFNYLSKKYINL